MGFGMSKGAIQISKPTWGLTQKDLEKTFAMGRDDPGTWLDSGMLHIVVDKKDDEDDGTGESGRLEPMKLTRSQRFLWDTIKMKKAQGLPSRLIIGKDRRRKVTTFFALWNYVACVTRAQERAVMIAHLDRTVEEIFKMGKIAHENNVFFKDIVKLAVNRKDTMGFVGNVGPYYVRDSTFWSTNASPKTASELRGLMVTMMHKTECPNFYDLEAINTASSATKSLSKHAVDVEESTFEGADNYFAESFLKNWEAQGSRNWDEPGYKAGKSAREAIFFPWHTNEVNRLSFMGGLEPGDLIGDFNDEEKELYRTALAYWTRIFIEERVQGDPSEMARRVAAECLLFRRAKLKPLFKDFVIPGNTLDSYGRIDKFYQEYPMSPEQAISASGKRPFFGPTLIEYARDTSQKEPVFRGFIHPEEGTNFRLESNPAGDFTVWKWPHECKGPVDLCMDPHIGRENTRLSEEDCDMFWASSFEWSTGEQVCEYFTFDGADQRNPRIWAICKFLGSRRDVGGNWHMSEGRLPLVAEESVGGCVTMRFLQRACNYPPDKLFRDVTNISKEYTKRLEVLGWSPMHRKKFAVSKAFDYMLNSYMVASGNETSDDAAMRRRTVRSKRIADQMSYFVSTNDKEFAAERKGLGGDKSRDDGVTTLYISAYIQETWILERGRHFLEVPVDTEGEVEYKIINGDALSLADVEAHEASMRKKERSQYECKECQRETTHTKMGTGDWQCLTCGSLLRKLRHGVSMYRDMADFRKQRNGDGTFGTI